MMCRRAYQIWLSHRCSCAFVVCLFLATRAFALDPQKAITQFTHRSWGAKDGLDKVYCITQTSDGYLWISAGNRVFRFDGINFTRWQPKLGEPGAVGPLGRILGTRDG